MKLRPKHYIAVAAFLSGITVVPALYWVNGFNFDERGHTALTCAVASLAVGGFGFVAAVTYPDQV